MSSKAQHVLSSSAGALKSCFSLGCWERECSICSCLHYAQCSGTKCSGCQFQGEQQEALPHRAHRHMSKHPVSSLMLFTAFP